MTRCGIRGTQTRVSARMVMLSAFAASLVACGGGSGDANSTTPSSTGGATSSPTQTTQTSPSTSVDDTVVTFVDRASNTTTATYTVVSCARPDPLGLKLVAEGVDGEWHRKITIDAAGGSGTYRVVSVDGSGGRSGGSPVPVRLSAGPNGALLVDFEVTRVTVTCG